MIEFWILMFAVVLGILKYKGDKQDKESLERFADEDLELPIKTLRKRQRKTPIKGLS